MNNNKLYTIYTNYLDIKLNSTNISYSIEYERHLIGIFDKKLKIWYNAWSINNYNIKDKNYNNYNNSLSKELLKYAIDAEIHTIDDVIRNIIKSIICNSKIYITEYKTQLELIIAIFLYFTKKKLFIIEKQNNLFFFYALNKNMPLLK